MTKMNLVASVVGMFVIGMSAAYAQTAPMPMSGGSMANMPGMNMPASPAKPVAPAMAPTAKAPSASMAPMHSAMHKKMKHKMKHKMMKKAPLPATGGMGMAPGKPM